MHASVPRFDPRRRLHLLGPVLFGQLATLVVLADPVGIGMFLFDEGGGLGFLAHANVPELLFKRGEYRESYKEEVELKGERILGKVIGRKWN